jgi:adenine-specific DNA-methyltransferase
VRYEVRRADFVLSFADRLSRERSLFDRSDVADQFDVAIGNPPYFKIAKSDPRAVVADAVVHGQPNIYALFMAIAGRLLSREGQMVFITPRSFASGHYFKRFREEFFRDMRPDAIHAFGSRKEAFRRDDVLQENIILRASRRSPRRGRGCDVVSISTSSGSADLSDARSRQVPISAVLDTATPEQFLFVPTSDEDDQAIAIVDSWTGTLHRHGLEISTGPVVAFRATDLIHEKQDEAVSRVPLLWMQHVRAMRIDWPLIETRKEQFIDAAAGERSLLVPDRNYVVLRRFSAKEEARRLVAAPLVAGRLGFKAIGLENHLNYIHRPKGQLDEDETWGLAAIYNSLVLDRYFRALNGSTQVNATELRAIPLPDRDTILEIGRRVRGITDPVRIDRSVADTLGLVDRP